MPIRAEGHHTDDGYSVPAHRFGTVNRLQVREQRAKTIGEVLSDMYLQVTRSPTALCQSDSFSWMFTGSGMANSKRIRCSVLSFTMNVYGDWVTDEMPWPIRKAKI
jgi:hypothetical protein